MLSTKIVKREIENKFNKNIDDLEFLNEGSSRKVYALTKNKVLKVAYNKKGLLQNLIEFTTFKLTLKEKHHNLLAKIFEVIIHRNKILAVVMERLKHLSYYEFDRVKNQKTKTVTNKMLAKYSYYEGGDLASASSWGTDNKGKMKCLDYGFNSVSMVAYQYREKDKNKVYKYTTKTLPKYKGIEYFKMKDKIIDNEVVK